MATRSCEGSFCFVLLLLSFFFFFFFLFTYRAASCGQIRDTTASNIVSLARSAAWILDALPASVKTLDVAHGYVLLASNSDVM